MRFPWEKWQLCVPLVAPLVANSSDQPKTVKGPESYENWRLAGSGQPPPFTTEYPIYSDAHVTGAIFEGYGPYQLFNTVPFHQEFHVALPVVVLRMAEHRTAIDFNDPGQMSRTQDDSYHAGGIADEVAAIMSLCLGIRAQAGDTSHVLAPRNTTTARRSLIAQGASRRCRKQGCPRFFRLPRATTT
jgi:hypothetical protein